MRDALAWTVALIGMGVRPEIATKWSTAFEKHVTADRFSLGEREIDDFLGQTLHETAMLEKLSEDLNYSAARLMQVWPARFPTVDVAEKYAYNAPGLAEKVYQGRMGNVEPGAGYKYRGRGVPMVTGHDNYAELARLTGLPLLESPDLLAQPDAALRCGVLWWEGHVPDAVIDNDELVTRRVNGGVVGLLDRKRLTQLARDALKQTEA